MDRNIIRMYHFERLIRSSFILKLKGLLFSLLLIYPNLLPISMLLQGALSGRSSITDRIKIKMHFILI